MAKAEAVKFKDASRLTVCMFCTSYVLQRKGGRCPIPCPAPVFFYTSRSTYDVREQELVWLNF